MPKIIEAARASGDFTTLLKAVETAGLTEALDGDGPYTVFAPTDEAFGKLSDLVLTGLLDAPKRLSGVLTLHVVPGRLVAEQVAERSSLETLHGQELPVVRRNGTIRIGDATVTQADIEVDNGMIHVIDTVLLPR